MAKTAAQLEQQLDTYSTQALPPMISARKLTLKTTRKPEKIEVLARAIMSRDSTRAAFDKLKPEQKVLLRLLRDLGAYSTIAALKIAAGAVGLARFDEHLDALMTSALVLYAEPTRVRHELWNARPAYSSWNKNAEFKIEIVETARELADDSIPLPPPAHALQAYAQEPYSIEEQSPASLLHVLWSVTRWASEREITLTKTTNTLRKADLKALDGLLKEQGNLKGFAIALALGTGLLLQQRERITADAESSEFFARAPRAQIERLFQSWLRLENWSEFFHIAEIETDNQIIPRSGPGSYEWDYSSSDVPTAQSLVGARAYLIGILKRAGGQSLGQWQSLASLQTLVKAENPEFLIPPRRARYSYGRRGEDEYEGFWPRGQNRWNSGFARGADWNQVEGRFLRQMLAEPGCWLGLVAIARDKNGEVVAFRLSPLGAHLLGLSDQIPDLEAQTQGEKPLIVQPNFEIIAYTDAGHLRALYQLERFATRERAERVAHYKLSRDSVYRGLQDGLSAAEMREFLEQHSRSGVPQNIAYSLDDWEKLWQSITLAPAASVIEAGTETEMDAFLGTLPAGAATRLAPNWATIEARYLEAARDHLATKSARAFDYGLAIERAFTTDENLKIAVPRANLDLWLQSKLEQFAEPLPDERSKARFQITPDSMARALKLGLKADDVTEFLAQTGTPPIPANVTLTVQGWGGAVKPVALGAMQVLVAAPAVIAQIAAIEALRPLLWLGAGEGAALIQKDDVPRLRAELKKRGIALDGEAQTHLSAPRAATPQAAPSRLCPPSRAVAVGNGKARNAKTAKVAAHPDEGDVDLQSGLDSEETEKLIEGAIEKSRCVVIEYQSKVRRALRKINPLQLFEDGDNVYLGAWDHWRQASRVFRVDRILGIAVLDEKFDPGKFE